jgi:hypothetical protein
MSNNTISVNGGAMPKVNRTAIMTRAWAIFHQTYCYAAPSFPTLAVTASTLAYAKHGQGPNQPSGLPRHRQRPKRIGSPPLPTPLNWSASTIIGHLPARESRPCAPQLPLSR